MVESEADGLSEEVMLGAVVFGHEQMQVAIKAINELAAAGGQADAGTGSRPPTSAELDAAPWRARAEARCREAYLDHREAAALRARSREIKAADDRRARRRRGAEVHRRRTSTTHCSSSRATSFASAS